MRLPVRLRDPVRIAHAAMLIASLVVAGCGPAGERGVDVTKAPDVNKTVAPGRAGPSPGAGNQRARQAPRKAVQSVGG